MKRLLWIGLVGLMAGCGGNGGGGGFPAVEVSYVTVSPETVDFSWIGQRQQLSATAWDADDNPIPGVAFHWESSDPSIMVDSAGLATALNPGAAEVTATELVSADGQSASAMMTAADESPIARGITYTLWSALSINSTAWIENGRLKTNKNTVSPDAIYDVPTPWGRSGVEKFQWEGDRIGILSDMANGAGTLRVMDRHEEWTLLGKADIREFQLWNNWIGVLHDDGRFRVKEGVHGPWTVLANGGIRHFQFSGNRIGELNDDGRFRVKTGIHGKWTVLANGGIRHFQLTGTLTGELNDAGRFRVKEGTHGPWTVLAEGGVTAFKLAGNRIAVLHDDGRFRVKDGIHGTWRLLATEGVREFQLSGNLIGVLYDDGRLRVKEGLDGVWRDLAAGGIRLFRLQSPYIAEVTDGGLLRVKEGIDGVWANITVNPDGVTQIQPIVAVPDSPKRTTPASYNVQQEKCVAELASGLHCEYLIHDAFPVPHYGRWCGGGYPTDEQAGWARAAGPIDSLDAICIHHDNYDRYYPAGIRMGGFHSCIVRYGIVHGRLTYNGRRLTAGTNQWVWAWNHMNNLWRGIYGNGNDDYDTVTGNHCDETQLQDFTADTASAW